jgi:putative heme utilization carrier protein HutX
MNDAAISPKLIAALAAEPGAVFETVAKEHNATLRQTVDALPEAMRRYAPASSFVEIMGEVANWGDVTLIIHSDDGVMEFTGPIPAGSVGRGYYNIAGSTGFHGHLKHERCAGIAFVERPFFGRPSASMLFFNVDGGVMFKIFVGRDEKRELLPNQLSAFRAMADRLCEPQKRSA